MWDPAFLASLQGAFGGGSFASIPRHNVGFVPQMYGGAQVSEEDARDARNRALLAAGLQLLQTAPQGNLAGGLAGAAQTFMGTIDQSLERRRELAREREQDERQKRAAEDTHLSAALSRREAEQGISLRTKEDAQRDQDRARTEDLRKRRSQSASTMIATIEQAAGVDSPEARQARALGELGEDADVARLAELHDKITARARFPEDQKIRTDAELAEAQAKAKLGFGPISDAQRERQRIAQEAERIRLARESGGGQGKAPTVAQRNDDIKAEADVLFRSWFDRQPKKRETRMVDGKLATVEPPSPAEILKARQDAIQQATSIVSSRYGTANGGMSPGIYEFDASGNLVSRP